MSNRHPSGRRWLAGVVMVLALYGLVGCSGTKFPKTYPAKGKVVGKGGKPWNGGETWITFQLKSDPEIVARGKVAKDGSFTLATQIEGKQRAGAAEGEHSVLLDPPAPPGEALPIIITPYVVAKTYTVKPGENEFTVEVESFGARSRAEK